MIWEPSRCVVRTLFICVMLTADGRYTRVDFALAMYPRRPRHCVVPLLKSPARQRVVARQPYRAAQSPAGAASPSGWARRSVLRPAQLEGEGMSMCRGVFWDVGGRI